VSRGPERGEVEIGCARLREDRLAREQGREQEQDGEEGVAAEDVAEGELVVAHPGRGQPGRALGEGGGQSEHGGAEDDTREPETAEELLAAALHRDAGHERGHRGGEEDEGDARGAAALLAGAGVLLLPAVTARLLLAGHGSRAARASGRSPKRRR